MFVALLMVGCGEDEQKMFKKAYKDGKIMSAFVWKPNGEKCSVTNVKDGNGVVVSYKRDGTELYRLNYKDGEELTPNP